MKSLAGEKEGSFDEAAKFFGLVAFWLRSCAKSHILKTGKHTRVGKVGICEMIPEF